MDSEKSDWGVLLMAISLADTVKKGTDEHAKYFFFSS